MRAYSLFTIDTRYSVPTLSLLIVEEEECAIELANAKLFESAFHTAVELHDDTRLIYRKTKAKDLLDQPPAQQPSRNVTGSGVPALAVLYHRQHGL